MESDLEVLFTPAEFGALSRRDLGNTVCVVFDVLRATSSMVTALGNGASGILPVADISEALACRKDDPAVLLAGEREGLRIGGKLTGGVEFDLGNSPREFTAEKVRGRRIVMTTTNGTRALRACAGARKILVSSFLNLKATADFLRSKKPGKRPAKLLLVCSGTFEEVALEDVLGAGALLDLLGNRPGEYAAADSVWMARDLYQQAKADLPGALSLSRNAQRLRRRPKLKGDVAFCAQRDVWPMVVTMEKNGWVRKGAR
jgi:2-phosphosulfolactate phosphatase